MSAATSAYPVGRDSGWHCGQGVRLQRRLAGGFGNVHAGQRSSSLSGTFTSSKADAAAPTNLAYTVLAGTGTFAGYSGSGSSSGTTDGDAFGLPGALVTFTESGSFNLTPIPEPTTALLLVAGLAGAALRLRRRRSDEK